MKTVYQRGESDCGIAALAMLGGISYEAAQRYAETNFEHHRRLSSGKIIRGLRAHGRKALDERCRAIGERGLYHLLNDALVKGKLLILDKHGRTKEHWHWVVWDCAQQVIRDPYGYDYPFQAHCLIEIE
jgi:hypothetical protein